MTEEFAHSEPFTIGVEEELLLVEPDGGRLAPVAAELLAAMDRPDGAAGHEAYAAEIELRSPIARDIGEVTSALAAGRAAARDAGATLMGAGLHPTAQLGDAQLVDSERYRKVEEEMRGLIRRTPECALHVHVGMPDADTAIRVFNALREQLPLLQGLSANSAWWFGRDSGLASARYAQVQTYPGRGVPRAFRDFDDYAETVAATLAAGDLDDYTLLWWDVRLQPTLGTVELRELDAQAPLADVAALAGLVHALARQAAEQPTADPTHREAIAWSTFRAARDGLDATILNGGELRPLVDVARDTVDAVRPSAREVGADGALAEIERILSEGNGAARQRAVHARRGTPAMLGALVTQTMAL
jgi:carboxylate-amine ligase